MLTGIPGVPIDDGPEGESADEPDHVPGQLIIEFAEGVSDQAREYLLQSEGATIVQEFYGLDYALIDLPGAGDIYAADIDEGTIEHWLSYPEVTYASPNRYLSESRAVPNDTNFFLQWDKHNVGQVGGFPDSDIDAIEAWDIFTGTDEVVVAIIDTGVDYLHIDLDDNMWRNPGETPGDGIDNDGNGYIDDVYGIAPANDAFNTDPMDTDGHGTHVAGTVGAEGNNGLGVTGVNWEVELMAVNIGNGLLGFTEGAIASGISYVTMMREQYGVNVVASNNSWGGYTPSVLIYDVIEQHIDSGILFVSAAGNDTNNNDAVPSYPDGYDLDGIISVAATDYFDNLTAYSNFGQTTVDLAAPGGDGGQGDLEGILSTWPPGVGPASYEWIQGTSMASPQVAGVAALIRGLAPELSVLETKQLMMDTVDVLPWLQGFVATSGRLNAATALEHIFTSQIEGNVWRDDNGNGTRDNGEAGIANWTVYLDLDTDGNLDIDEPSAVTDADGNYSLATFEAPGTYTVAQVERARWNVTYPSIGVHQVTIQTRGDTVTGINFGNQPEPGSITGFKWHDIDGDGIRDPDEPGQGGVWIYADVNNDGMIGLLEPAAVTASDGSYAIYDIPAGEMAIRESLPLGWATTYPALGYHVVDVIPATTISNIDFGNTASFDFGDAPSDAGYPTLAEDGGAYHGVTPGFQLGALIDAEDDGIPSATAVGDDLDNLADEDGVVIDGAFFQGTSATIDVTIENTGFPLGFLHGWIDYNADGDWNDAGEQIISNMRLGDGTYPISFDVPSGVIVGGSFARFRYGIERDLLPTGGSTVGEVEDYEVLILKDEPVANPDTYEVPQNSVNNELEVLVNDFPSSTGELTITEVTQPANGTVFIAPGGQTVIFTPDFGTFSPPAEQFTYMIDDGDGKTDSTTVTLFVRPELQAPLGVDDIYRVSTDETGNDLHVLDNDLTGILGTMQLVSVAPPSSGSAVINNNGTSDPLDDYIVYTPNDTFARADQFEYTISNANGISTAIVTVTEDPAPDDLTVELSVSFEDSSGTPTTEVDLGDEFSMIVSVADIRDPADYAELTDEDDMGVFSAYLDVLYDRELVLPVLDATNPVGVELTYGESYPDSLGGAEGDSDTPGLINEVGAFVVDYFTPLGPGNIELLRITFTANTVGVAEFFTDPFDEPTAETPDGPKGRSIVHYTPDDVVPYTDVYFNASALTIRGGSSLSNSGGGEGENPADVDNDGAVSARDILLVVNHVNNVRKGTARNETGSFNPRLDVDRDTVVSARDVLMVVQALNGNRGGEGEGEGESLIVSRSLGSEQLDLLDSDPVTVLATLEKTVYGPKEVAAESTATVAEPVADAIDWQTQVGQAIAENPTAVEMANVASQPWESLLNTLAEDVLEAWLDGDDA